MRSKNLNYQFYQEYFQNVDFKNVDAFGSADRNRELCSNRFNDALISDTINWDCSSLVPKSFSLATTYPGLLLGAGVVHAFGGKGEAALGFTFDYVTGLPYIPGSSLKGLLRSAFTLSGGAYVSEKLKDIKGQSFEKHEILKLELSIFGPRQSGHSAEADGKDVFLDSYISGTKSSDGTFLAMDTITPHHQGVLGELSSPNPISFIKVKPGVAYEFRFLLSNYDNGGLTLTADDKAKLFEEILLELGIGAKTNVGYGNLAQVSAEELSCWRESARRAFAAQPQRQHQAQAGRQQSPIPSEKTIHNAANGIHVGDIVAGIVTGIQPYGAFVKLDGTSQSGLLHISEIANERGQEVSDFLEVGQHVIVKILANEPKIKLSMKGISQP